MCTKVCYQCEEEKDLTEFYKVKRDNVRVVGPCKSCTSINGKVYRANNKDKISLKNKNYLINNREMINMKRRAKVKERRDEVKPKVSERKCGLRFV